MTVAPDRFETVAWVYNQSELAVLLSRLAHEDINVVPISRGHVSVQWEWTVALGGVEIRVHAEDADLARASLAGISRAPIGGYFFFDNRLLDLAMVLLLFAAALWMPPARIPAFFVLGSPSVREDHPIP